MRKTVHCPAKMRPKLWKSHIVVWWPLFYQNISGKEERDEDDKPKADAFLWESWFPWPLAVIGRLRCSIVGQDKEARNLFPTVTVSTFYMLAVITAIFHAFNFGGLDISNLNLKCCLFFAIFLKNTLNNVNVHILLSIC